MKLATYKDGSRDGQLVVVSRDLSSAHYAAGIATRLQQVLDDWNFIAPQLQDLYETLSGGKARHAFAFEPQKCMAPLPRAYLCAMASQPGRGGARPIERLPSDPLAGGRDDAVLADADAGARGIPVPALAAITGDIAAATPAPQALEGVRLLMLAQGWRHAHAAAPAPIADEPAEPAVDAETAPPGGAQDPGDDRPIGASSDRVPEGPAKTSGDPLDPRLASIAFGPVAITPDELGAAWQQGRLEAVLQRRGIGRQVERLEGGPAVPFGVALERLAREQALRAGAIVLGVWADVSEEAPAADGLRAGDASRLKVTLADGAEPFGSLEQTVTVPLGR